MTASLETLVIAAYVFAEALSIPRSGPKGKVTDAELIALAVAQAAMGVPSDRQFLGLVGKALPGFFPHLPDQSQFNRRLRRLGPWLSTTQLGVAELIASGSVRLADDALIGRQKRPPLSDGIRGSQLLGSSRETRSVWRDHIAVPRR